MNFLRCFPVRTSTLVSLILGVLDVVREIVPWRVCLDFAFCFLLVGLFAGCNNISDFDPVYRYASGTMPVHIRGAWRIDGLSPRGDALNLLPNARCPLMRRIDTRGDRISEMASQVRVVFFDDERVVGQSALKFDCAPERLEGDGCAERCWQTPFEDEVTECDCPAAWCDSEACYFSSRSSDSMRVAFPVDLPTVGPDRVEDAGICSMQTTNAPAAPPDGGGPLPWRIGLEVLDSSNSVVQRIESLSASLLTDADGEFFIELGTIELTTGRVLCWWDAPTQCQCSQADAQASTCASITLRSTVDACEARLPCSEQMPCVAPCDGGFAGGAMAPLPAECVDPATLSATLSLSSCDGSALPSRELAFVESILPSDTELPSEGCRIAPVATSED